MTAVQCLKRIEFMLLLNFLDYRLSERGNPSSSAIRPVKKPYSGKERRLKSEKLIVGCFLNEYAIVINELA